MFYRIKKIRGKEYAYLVKNEWGERGSRQKVKGYIGRVYRFNVADNIDFAEHLKIESVQEYIEKNDKENILSDLVRWELFKHDISSKEFFIDVQKSIVDNKGKKVVLSLNDGFLCSITIKKLLDFKPEGEEQKDGFRLARAFVEAGIKVPQEIFIHLFSKLYKAEEGVQ